MTQVDHPPPIVSGHNVSLVRGVVSLGVSPYPGQGHNVRRDVTDQLRVSDVSYEPSLPPLSALSPSSFLFPSSDSGFLSLYSSAASLSSRTSVAFVSSASSSLYTSSFTPLSSSVSASSLPLPPLSYPPRPSVLSPAARVSAPPPPPGFPPLPPGIPPLSSSSFLVSSSFSTSLPLSAFSLASSSLPSVVSSVSSAPVSALPSSAPFGSSSSPYSSSSLDYASYKAHVLGISDEYLSRMRWYNSVDGSDFFSFLSSHCPHLSADVAKDFSSGSSVLLSTLRSSAALPFDPPASALGALPSSSLFSSAVPALPPSSVLPKGFAAAPAAPVSSTAFLSSLLSGLASLVGPPPLLAQSLSSSSLLPPSLSRAGGPMGFGAVVDPGPSVVPQYAPPASSLFRPFDAPSAGPSGVFSSSTSLPFHGSSPVFASAPPSGVPPPPVAPLGSSFSSTSPGPSFAPPQPGLEVPDDASFDPTFADPSALDPEPPLAPSVPDSVRAEIRRMYAYIVDLFPQAAGSPAAPPPPRALFEGFFVASPASTHLPVLVCSCTYLSF